MVWRLQNLPAGLGWTEVGARFVEVMGLTWAYSQVTKVSCNFEFECIDAACTLLIDLNAAV